MALRSLARPRAVVSLVSTCLTASCADSEASSWSGTFVALPNGAILVENPAAGLWSAVDAWRLEDTLWIGAADGDGPDVFGRIARLDVDSLGRIYVFDGLARELRIFEADGAFLSRFGRRGGGPGEFEGVIGMSNSVVDGLWLVDGPNTRYTAIRASSVDTYRRASPLYRVPWVGGHADGQLYDGVILPGERGTEVLVRVDRDGVARDTFRVPEPYLPVPSTGRISFPLPYAPKAIRAFDPRGFVWTATSHEYRLTRTSLSGDTVRIITRAVEAPPLEQTQRDSVERYARDLTAQFGQFGLDLNEAMIPRTAPLLHDITVADDGSLWVTRASGDRTTTVDIFDREGRYLGNIVVAFPLLQMKVRQGILYGIALGELEIPRVFRARIVA